MKPIFSIKDNQLAMKLKCDDLPKYFTLPRSADDMFHLKKWLDDLNLRASKIKNISYDTVTMNSHYLFFLTAKKEIRVKLPIEKQVAIMVDKDTHTMVKELAIKAKIPMKDYVKLCVVQCKGDTK